MITVDLEPIKAFSYCQISNYKFQFLLLDANYKALHSPFECKDYLNDMFFCEYTGVSSQIYGLLWKKGMIDMSQEFFHLALMGGSVELEDKTLSFQKFMNNFDKAQGIPLTKVHKTSDPKIIVVDFSKEWTQNGPLLSAYMTLLRIAQNYTPKENPIEYMKRLLAEETKGEHNPRYMRKDILNLPKYINRVAALLAGKKVKHEWSMFPSGDMLKVHNTGVIGYSDFPEVDAQKGV